MVYSACNHVNAMLQPQVTVTKQMELVYVRLAGQVQIVLLISMSAYKHPAQYILLVRMPLGPISAIVTQAMLTMKQQKPVMVRKVFYI